MSDVRLESFKQAWVEARLVDEYQRDATFAAQTASAGVMWDAFEEVAGWMFPKFKGAADRLKNRVRAFEAVRSALSQAGQIAKTNNVTLEEAFEILGREDPSAKAYVDIIRGRGYLEEASVVLQQGLPKLQDAAAGAERSYQLSTAYILYRTVGDVDAWARVKDKLKKSEAGGRIVAILSSPVTIGAALLAGPVGGTVESAVAQGARGILGRTATAIVKQGYETSAEGFYKVAAWIGEKIVAKAVGFGAEVGVFTVAGKAGRELVNKTDEDWGLNTLKGEYKNNTIFLLPIKGVNTLAGRPFYRALGRLPIFRASPEPVPNFMAGVPVYVLNSSGQMVYTIGRHGAGVLGFGGAEALVNPEADLSDPYYWAESAAVYGQISAGFYLAGLTPYVRLASRAGKGAEARIKKLVESLRSAGGGEVIHLQNALFAELVNLRAEGILPDSVMADLEFARLAGPEKQHAGWNIFARRHQLSRIFDENGILRQVNWCEGEQGPLAFISDEGAVVSIEVDPMTGQALRRVEVTAAERERLNILSGFENLVRDISNNTNPDAVDKFTRQLGGVISAIQQYLAKFEPSEAVDKALSDVKLALANFNYPADKKGANDNLNAFEWIAESLLEWFKHGNGLDEIQEGVFIGEPPSTLSGKISAALKREGPLGNGETRKLLPRISARACFKSTDVELPRKRLGSDDVAVAILSGIEDAIKEGGEALGDRETVPGDFSAALYIGRMEMPEPNDIAILKEGALPANQRFKSLASSSDSGRPKAGPPGPREVKAKAGDGNEKGRAMLELFEEIVELFDENIENIGDWEVSAGGMALLMYHAHAYTSRTGKYIEPSLKNIKVLFGAIDGILKDVRDKCYGGGEGAMYGEFVDGIRNKFRGVYDQICKVEVDEFDKAMAGKNRHDFLEAVYKFINQMRSAFSEVTSDKGEWKEIFDSVSDNLQTISDIIPKAANSQGGNIAASPIAQRLAAEAVDFLSRVGEKGYYVEFSEVLLKLRNAWFLVLVAKMSTNPSAYNKNIAAITEITDLFDELIKLPSEPKGSKYWGYKIESLNDVAEKILKITRGEGGDELTSGMVASLQAFMDVLKLVRPSYLTTWFSNNPGALEPLEKVIDLDRPKLLEWIKKHSESMDKSLEGNFTAGSSASNPQGCLGNVLAAGIGRYKERPRLVIEFYQEETKFHHDVLLVYLGDGWYVFESRLGLWELGSAVKDIPQYNEEGVLIPFEEYLNYFRTYVENRLQKNDVYLAILDYDEEGTSHIGAKPWLKPAEVKEPKRGPGEN